MKKKILIGALLLALVGSVASAFYPFGGVKFEAFVSDFTFNDENAVILIKYTGSEESGTLDMNSNSLEFHVGDVSSEAAGASTADINADDECGTTNGGLDVTDADCNTFGELVQAINANSSDHGWVAVLVGALPSEAIAGATDFVDPADKQCKQVGGCTLVSDGSVHDELPGLFAPWLNEPTATGIEGKLSIEPFLTRGQGGGQGQVLKGNPVSPASIPFLQRWTANQNSAGAGTFDVYSFTYGPTGNNSTASGDPGVPTARLIYQVTLADDTQLDSSANYLYAPLAGDPGSILFIRASAATAGTLTDTDDELNFHGFYGKIVDAQ